jgi:hypothetical protein
LAKSIATARTIMIENMKVLCVLQYQYSKKNANKEDNSKFDRDIIEAIKRIPLERRFQAISMNNLVMLKKQLDAQVEHEINNIVNKYNHIQGPILEKVVLFNQ